MCEKSAQESLSQLTETTRRRHILNENACLLSSLLRKVDKTRDQLVGKAEKRGGQVYTLESRTGLLQGETDLLKRTESTICDMNAVFIKETNTDSDVSGFLDGLRPDLFDLYVRILYCRPFIRKDKQVFEKLFIGKAFVLQYDGFESIVRVARDV